MIRVFLDCDFGSNSENKQRGDVPRALMISARSIIKPEVRAGKIKFRSLDRQYQKLPEREKPSNTIACSDPSSATRVGLKREQYTGSYVWIMSACREVDAHIPTLPGKFFVSSDTRSRTFCSRVRDPSSFFSFSLSLSFYSYKFIYITRAIDVNGKRKAGDTLKHYCLINCR
uniref:Uncharacterized protein n=1 Tax=Trichogramma kaykai TaxID=54128 RepID=A0ABD2W7I8_9HYME